MVIEKLGSPLTMRSLADIKERKVKCQSMIKHNYLVSVTSTLERAVRTLIAAIVAK